VTVNDILMLIVMGTYFGQRWENAYFYRVVALGGVFEEGDFPSLVQNWLDTYLTNIFNPHANHFHTSVLVTGARGENLFNVGGIGAYTLSSPIAGTLGGDGAAPQSAYGWSTPSLKRGMNPGQRRMPGATEATVANGGYIEAATLTVLANMGAAMGDNMIIEFGDLPVEATLQPVIVKRVRTGAGTDVDPYEYRLPRTASEGVTYRANNWTPRPVITTQNSRKYGRGI